MRSFRSFFNVSRSWSRSLSLALSLGDRVGLLSCVGVLALGAAAPLACGSSTDRTFVEDDDNSFGGADGGSSGGDPLNDCATDTKDVYVISGENGLYQFHPPDLSFKHVGMVACPTGGATPTSMAVDRRGIAWVRHSDGTLWKVSTKTLECEPVDYAPLDGSFVKFGMGFATATAGSTYEELFLSDSDGAGLAKLDTSSLGVRFIGPYTGGLDGKSAELTGTGAGKLYGFFTTTPAQIAEISKSTGEIINPKELPGVVAGNAWAFSFYGGDFYIYTSALPGSGGPPMAGAGSRVTRYRPSDGTIQVVKEAVGFKIVGAGVSTCAPTELPR